MSITVFILYRLRFEKLMYSYQRACVHKVEIRFYYALVMINS